MPNCPGAKLSGAKLSWCQIVLVPNCPLLLSWCQIVRFYYLGAKLSALLSWCQIFRCQIVRCQIVWCQIVLQSREFLAENGGLGKNHDNPPSDFGLEIENENDRKRAIKQLRSNQRNKLTCTFLALTLREVIPLKKMGQNFHICLRSGPTGLTPPPLTVRLTIKYPFFMTSLSWQSKPIM